MYGLSAPVCHSGRKNRQMQGKRNKKWYGYPFELWDFDCTCP